MSEPLYLENPADSFSLWSGEPINGVQYAPNIGDLMSDAELAAIGLYRPADADPVPSGQRVIGTSVQRVEGVVKYVHALEDIPLDDVKSGHVQLALVHAEEIGQTFLVAYPEVEQKSFPKKETEALLILGGEADPAKFPAISEEIALSGKTAMEAALRIAGKAAILERIAGALSGFRQRAEDDIDGSTSYAEVVAALDSAKAALAASLAVIISS